MDRPVLMRLLRSATLGAVAVALVSVLALSPRVLSLPGCAAAHAAAPGPTFNCSYDNAFIEIDYAVLGGTAGTTYTVTGVASGSIAFTEALHDLTGAADNDDSSIECTKKTTGKVVITFKEGTETLATCTINFTCAGEDETPEEIFATPTSTSTATPTATATPTPEPGVGGIAEVLAGGSHSPASPADGSGSSSGLYAAIVGGITAALAAAAGGWYARRRWLR